MIHDKPFNVSQERVELSGVDRRELGFPGSSNLS